ncbi:MAG: hypothetical protein ACRDRT_07170, partial [Pseudonocardiaceae bacterium]
IHLMEDILHRPVHERTRPDVGEQGLSEGNWLPFAIACRWPSELTFVFNDDRRSDVFVHHLENNDPEARNIQLKAVPKGEISRRHFELDRVEIVAREPLVPYREVLWSDFQTVEPYDFICLCRSPDYAPTSADAIYDEVQRRFVMPART